MSIICCPFCHRPLGMEHSPNCLGNPKSYDERESYGERSWDRGWPRHPESKEELDS